jgi:hypothetical protein
MKPALRVLFFRAVLGLFAAALPVNAAMASVEVVNAQALRAQLGLEGFGIPAGLSTVRIAILDNGFAGFVAGNGALPASARLIEGPGNPQAPTEHGMGMAEIVWAMTGHAPEGPQFFLINSNGFTNFKAAVDFVVRERVDIVLYSQTWAFGTNFDGTGFIDEAVSLATRAGAIWINAAGNFGGMVHQRAITPNLDRGTGWVRFDGGRDFLELENSLDENQATLTLSWNDFQASETYNTRQDLDLFVYDSNDRVVGSSELIQRGEAPPATGTSSLSSHARESITLRGLGRGTYRIRVRAKSDQFNDGSVFRVVVEAEKQGSIRLAQATPGAEIFAPADHPDVITVGERFELSSRGPTADGRAKPDTLVADSTVSFSNGNTVRGSSTAAALVAGAVVTMKARHPSLSAEQLRAFINGEGAATGSNGEDLRPASPTAFPPLPSEVTSLVPRGGKLMIHPNGHFIVISPMDPMDLPVFRALGATRANASDCLILEILEGSWQRRWASWPLAQSARVTAPWVEFRQASSTVAASASWRTPSPAELETW